MYEILFGELQFPVPPEQIKMSISNQNETMRLISGREINIPKVPGLSEVSLSLLLPAVPYPFAVYPDGFHTPDYYLAALEQWKIGKQPFQFKVNRHLPGGQYSFDTDLAVLLEEYSITEDAGDGFDITVDVKLKQYVPYGAKLVEVVENGDGSGATLQLKEQREAKTPPDTYTVRQPETLWGICRTVLGDETRYGEIAALNHIDNPNEILPGEVIRFA